MSSTFQSLGVPSDIADHLSHRGITAPFPIQQATIADAIAGADICGQAPTGSGKTLAFGIPTVMQVTKGRPRHPHALVLAPTRELAAQISDELSHLGRLRNRRVATFYGGVGYGAQLNALNRGIDIAVACPGRLLDLVERGAFNLSEVGIVVIDEADRMADMGFLPVVRKLIDQVPADRQTMLFSATLDGDVAELVRRYQHNPKRHELGTEDNAMERQTHRFYRSDAANRLAMLTDVVMHQPSTVVFCRTKHGVDRLARQLKQAGISAVPLHGDRTQAQRDRALESFRTGDASVLIGTDVAARGLDVEGVTCVVHFDPPADEKTYVHRSGRTARAGADGLVISFVSSDQVSTVRKMQAKLNLPVGFDREGAEERHVESRPAPRVPFAPAAARRSAPAQATRPGKRRRVHPPRAPKVGGGHPGGSRAAS